MSLSHSCRPPKEALPLKRLPLMTSVHCFHGLEDHIHGVRGYQIVWGTVDASLVEQDHGWCLHPHFTSSPESRLYRGLLTILSRFPSLICSSGSSWPGSTRNEYRIIPFYPRRLFPEPSAGMALPWLLPQNLQSGRRRERLEMQFERCHTRYVIARHYVSVRLNCGL